MRNVTPHRRPFWWLGQQAAGLAPNHVDLKRYYVRHLVITRSAQNWGRNVNSSFARNGAQPSPPDHVQPPSNPGSVDKKDVAEPKH